MIVPCVGGVCLQVRSLVSALVKDAVPATWKSGLVQADMGAAGWVDDLAKRLAHLESLSRSGKRSGAGASPYWLGGLVSPDAFVTASRQHVARTLSCSLEELRLSLVVGGEEESSAGREGDGLSQGKEACHHDMHNVQRNYCFVPNQASRNSVRAVKACNLTFLSSVVLHFYTDFLPGHIPRDQVCPCLSPSVDLSWREPGGTRRPVLCHSRGITARLSPSASFVGLVVRLGSPRRMSKTGVSLHRQEFRSRCRFIFTRAVGT